LQSVGSWLVILALVYSIFGLAFLKEGYDK